LIQIPKQLQHKKFRFVKTKLFEKRVWRHCTKQLQREDLTEKQRVELYQKLIRPKTPMEKGYKKNRNYQFDDPNFQQYLKTATGYAVLTGVGDLVVVESDSKELSLLVEKNFKETFTVCSRKNEPYRKHFYFIVSNFGGAMPLDNKKGNHLGEIQSGKALVTGANSIHAVTGEPYTIVNDVSIAEIEKKSFLEVFKPYIENYLENEYVEDYYSDFPEYDIDITDIIDFNNLKEQSEGRWQGRHPVHGSSTGRNFAVFPERNYWRCFRHRTYGGVFSLIAMKHGIINCEDVKKGCLKGKKWEKTLEAARKNYNLEISDIKTKENADSETKKINLGNTAYLIYESEGDIAKVTKQKKQDKVEYVFKGLFKPVRRLILDGQKVYEVSFGDNYIGTIPEIVNKMKQQGGVLSNFLITDSINAVLSDSDIPTLKGHSTYGVYNDKDKLYYCTDPFPKTDEQKLICNKVKESISQPISKENLQNYADMLTYWDPYEILPAMSWGIMASFGFVLRKKGLMFQFLWHNSLESDLGKTTIGLIFSTHLWGVPDSSGDSLASAFRVSDTLDSIGGLRVLNEGEKLPWRSTVGQILKHSAERSLANKRGKSSGGSDYYFSRAAFIITSNGFPISSGNDLIRIFKIEFNLDRKKERQENRKKSQELSKKLRRLEPIGYQLVKNELEDINFSLKELISRCNRYGDQIIDNVNISIKSDRRVTGYGIMYEGLKAWERIFKKYGVNWKAPSIKEFSKDIVEKIESFTFESKILPITEFLFWFENYRDSPTGEIKFQKTWDEKEIEITGDKVKGTVVCYPILTEYKRQMKDNTLSNLGDIARAVSSITSYPIEEIYHPRRFIVGEKTKRAVFLPDDVFEETDIINKTDEEEDLDVEKYSFVVKNVENVVGKQHISKDELQKRLGIKDEKHYNKTIRIVNTAIYKKSFKTTLQIDKAGNYYNNTNIKNDFDNENFYIGAISKNGGNKVTEGIPTEEKNGYLDSNNERGRGNDFQQEKKQADYLITPNSERQQHIKKTIQKYHCINQLEKLNKILKTIAKNNIKNIAIDTETTSTNVQEAKLVGISFSYQPNEAYYLPIGHSKQIDQRNLPKKETLDLLKKHILENKDINKIGQNIKYDYHILKNEGITVAPISFDTMLASYVLNPNNRKSLDKLAKRHCNYEMQPIKELLGNGKKAITFDKVPIDKASFYACEDSDYTFQIYKKLEHELNKEKNKQLKKVFYEMELQLIPVVADMERTGIAIDTKKLKTVTEEINKEIKQLEEAIYKEADEKFNINSTKDLQYIFFEKLKFKVVEKTPKGQPSTDTETLQILSKEYKLPKLLLRYRELNKLFTTYLIPYPNFINKETNRIHASFNQAGSVSGRFSSSKPNLQNIPPILRKTFIPKNKDYVFLGADYSQMELKILAHFSEDKNLIKAFKSGKDIHKLTAAHVLNTPYKKVTDKQRSVAKTINFGIVYGMSAYGLAARTDFNIEEAKKFINSYFKLYPDVKRYLSKMKGYALKHGYIFTLYNRHIHLKKIFSKDRKVREEGLRQAQNMPIQGTGADILKLVMIELYKRLKKFDAKLILTVHDELIFEVAKKDLEQVKQIVSYEMENIVKLAVPLEVNIGIGSNWYAAKN
jgi:DNA polymerase I